MSKFRVRVLGKDSVYEGVSAEALRRVRAARGMALISVPRNNPPAGMFVAGACLICNGAGETCASCGEAEGACLCDAYAPQDCPECVRAGRVEPE